MTFPIQPKSIATESVRPSVGQGASCRGGFEYAKAIQASLLVSQGQASVDPPLEGKESDHKAYGLKGQKIPPNLTDGITSTDDLSRIEAVHVHWGLDV